ncbi:hypothetical protein ACFL0L_05365 [Patescibacteria group bacterium]
MPFIPAAHAAESASEFISNINWAEPTWDLFIILFFVVAAFLYGLSLGRDRIIVILVSIYMALAVVEHAPFISDPGFQEGVNNAVSQLFVFRISAFLVVFVFLFFMLSRSALVKTIASTDSHGRWWQVLLFSILHVGLIVSITLSFLPEEAAQGLAPFTQNLFASSNAQFVWIILPIAAMILIKGGASDTKKFKYDI